MTRFISFVVANLSLLALAILFLPFRRAIRMLILAVYFAIILILTIMILTVPFHRLETRGWGTKSVQMSKKENVFICDASITPREFPWHGREVAITDVWFETSVYYKQSLLGVSAGHVQTPYRTLCIAINGHRVRGSGYVPIFESTDTSFWQCFDSDVGDTRSVLYLVSRNPHGIPTVLHLTLSNPRAGDSSIPFVVHSDTSRSR